MLIRTFLVAAVALAASGCITTNYRPYEGAAPQVGTGGTRATVSGVDIWDDGTPPRKYIVLGIIDDKRSKGRIDQASFENDIAEKVREVGGDAAILSSREEAIRGYVSSGSGQATVTRKGTIQGTSSGAVIPVGEVSSKIQVIRYLD